MLADGELKPRVEVVDDVVGVRGKSAKDSSVGVDGLNILSIFNVISSVRSSSVYHGLLHRYIPGHFSKFVKFRAILPIYIHS